MKIALALIVKGTKEEAEFLDKCLENTSKFVDAIYVTSTYPKGKEPNKAINRVCAKYNANVSYFQWVDDFAKARNFNFSQVPKDYDYILWCDADDVFRGLEKLRDTIKDNDNVDAFAFNYLYAFDNFKNPIVVHKKTQVLRNDGCVEWVGKLHEDFKENRGLNVKFVTYIERMHMTTDDHVKDAIERNVRIAKLEAKENPNDPKMYFNLGNSLFQAGNFKDAKKAYLTFLESSQSEDEKYIIYQRLSATEKALGNQELAIQDLQIAIGMMPEYPEAFNSLGYLCFGYNLLEQAEKYLMMGLVMRQPHYHKMIAYNPRDYDYNPMMALAKVYFNKARPDLALPLLKGCLEIYPTDQRLRATVKEMEIETARLNKVVEAVQHIETLGDDKKKILYTIEKLPEDLQSHPAICRIRNKYFVKEESSGKDIAYYCGQTSHEWNPEMAQTKGIGGSEEAVINLSKQWVKSGYNVTVFNSCGAIPMTVDGVTYKPYWHYNHLDKYDITILWRRPNLADYDLNTTQLFVDMHDVIPSGEFTEKRLKKIDKVFVKTHAHRDLFLNVPDEKIAIIPNGQDNSMFEDTGVEKNPYMLVNTSSPERSMDVLPKLFKEVKRRVPEARLKWAYGFEIFDNAHKNNSTMMEWKEKCLKEMEEAGIENMGRLSQAETAKLYMEGRILAYPSEFYEIDCISVKKAEYAMCVPVTSDFAAFKESNQYGVCIPSKKTIENWSKPYQIGFGIEDIKAQEAWVDTVVDILEKPMLENQQMMEWAKKFDWSIISNHWINKWQKIG